jgi:predicted alpha/beta hydrolase family esterase
MPPDRRRFGRCGSVSVLILPGYADSGPGHWQTLWERRHGYLRVVQDDWLAPERAAWVRTLEHAVRRAQAPVVLVAHSLGGILVAHWAQQGTVERVRGALLVAPPDVDEAQFMLPEVASFAPIPLAPLPFQAIVVASTTDPYVDPARARQMAAAWQARLVDIGDAGHVNAESALGDWPAGHRLLEDLLATN